METEPAIPSNEIKTDETLPEETTMVEAASPATDSGQAAPSNADADDPEPTAQRETLNDAVSKSSTEGSQGV
jgi:hypothetical protein